MMLTETEIYTALNSVSACVQDRDIVYSRAIEAAVLAKLQEQQENVVVIEAVPLNELFQRAIVKHLGLESLLHEKVSPYQIAERFFHAGYAVRHPAPIPEGRTLVPTEILDAFPEINPSNYDHDDACKLNAWGVELVLAARSRE